jgi:L,D-transpeptidase ErfK/SrfK
VKHYVKQGETITQIAKDYRKPIYQILAVNKLENPNLIYPGQIINIPGYPSPESIPFEIIVSLSNRKLTLFKNNTYVKTYPIAVGRILHTTPQGTYIIINKAPNPGGPFGTMWMSLSKEHYGIHGTNNPSSIGKAVSKGCIRMYNKDVEELSQTVPIGTRVVIRL